PDLPRVRDLVSCPRPAARRIRRGVHLCEHSRGCPGWNRDPRGTSHGGDGRGRRDGHCRRPRGTAAAGTLVEWFRLMAHRSKAVDCPPVVRTIGTGGKFGWLEPLDCPNVDPGVIVEAMTFA